MAATDKGQTVEIRVQRTYSVGAHLQGERFRRILDQAWEQINLFDEHTWGASDSITNPDSLYTTEQWLHKAVTAHIGSALSFYVVNRVMNEIAGNAEQADGVQGVLLVNPTSVTQVFEIRLPDSLLHSARHIQVEQLRFNPILEDPNYNIPCYGIVALEPFSWREVPLNGLNRVQQSADVWISHGRIETPFYVLKFNPDTGWIYELYDKTTNWQVIDQHSPWTFFQFVRETIDSLKAPEQRRSLFQRDLEKIRRGASCWVHNWPAVRRGANQLKGCRVERHDTGVTLWLEWDAPGTHGLEQLITLFAHRPGIELVARIHKDDIRIPESMYFVFPLNLQRWTARYDTADTLVTLDKEQLPGVSRDWITVDKVVAVFDETHAALLACPDAPLVQVGGFRFGQESKCVSNDQPPLLVAWPINNLWDTNFRASQPGFISLRYEFKTLSTFDPHEMFEFGVSTGTPVTMVPMYSCSQERGGSLLKYEGDSITPIYLKSAEDGRGVIVRLINLGDTVGTVRLTLPESDLEAAYTTNCFEEDEEQLKVSASSVCVSAAPRQIKTVRLIPAKRHEDS